MMSKKGFIIIACFMLLPCHVFGGESTLPFPIHGESDGALPAPPIVVTVDPLPNPGTYFGTAETLASEGYKYKGRVYDVYYYDSVPGWNSYMNEWLMACESAGFTWEAEKIDGNQAYVITSGKGQALFFPEYSGTIMLMIENTLEMEKAEPIDKELEFKTIRMVFNGTQYTFTNAEAFKLNGSIVCKGYDVSHNMLGWVYLPTYIETGSHYRITKEDANEYGTYDFTFLIEIGHDQYSAMKFTGPGDYIDVTIDFCDLKNFGDTRKIQCSYEAVLENGKDEISIEVNVPYSY